MLFLVDPCDYLVGIYDISAPGLLVLDGFYDTLIETCPDDPSCLHLQVPDMTWAKLQARRQFGGPVPSAAPLSLRSRQSAYK